MRAVILILSLLVAVLFGYFVPGLLTDDFEARMVIAVIGGFLIGSIGLLIAGEFDD